MVLNVGLVTSTVVGVGRGVCLGVSINLVGLEVIEIVTCGGGGIETVVAIETESLGGLELNLVVLLLTI